MGSLLQAGPACFMKPLPWKERCPPAQTGAQGLAWAIVTLQYCGTQQGNRGGRLLVYCTTRWISQHWHLTQKSAAADLLSWDSSLSGSGTENPSCWTASREEGVS
ncbi:unnamed protein product [Arctogadus glacialis]